MDCHVAHVTIGLPDRDRLAGLALVIGHIEDILPDKKVAGTADTPRPSCVRSLVQEVSSVFQLLVVHLDAHVHMTDGLLHETIDGLLLRLSEVEERGPRSTAWGPNEEKRTVTLLEPRRLSPLSVIV